MTKNNKVSYEGYAAPTANWGSNLISNYILNGITFGGITGKLEVLNTSDATAAPEDIIWGETAYVDGKKITGTRVVTVAHGKASQKVFDENTTLIDDYGNSVKVPAGFKIASDSATSVTGGVVIEDSTAGDNYTKGSQFVWIPVGKVKTNSSGSTTEIQFGRYSFSDDASVELVQLAENWEDTSDKVAIGKLKELESSTYGNSTAKNLEGFIKKVASSGGYYIGRYEAGDAYATNSERTSSANDSNPIVCKAGVYPYNYISELDASRLCKGMYSNSNFESDLINSYAWDTAIVFIQTFSGDLHYSIQGRLQTTIAKCGEATDGTNKDVRCNIFDMAGNTREFTTETFTDINSPCSWRGGSIIFYADNPGRRYGVTTSDGDYRLSARPILYL